MQAKQAEPKFADQVSYRNHRAEYISRRIIYLMSNKPTSWAWGCNVGQELLNKAVAGVHGIQPPQQMLNGHPIVHPIAQLADLHPTGTALTKHD